MNQLTFKDDVLGEKPINQGSTPNMVHISFLWRRQNNSLLSQMTQQNPEDWIELDKLSRLLPENLKERGLQLSSRCLLLWKILTIQSGQVDQSDLQQIISWKKAFSEYPGQKTPWLDFRTNDYTLFPTKAFFDLEHFQYPNTHLKANKGEKSVNSPTNPWLSLPLLDFSVGFQQEQVNKVQSSTDVSYGKQGKNNHVQPPFSKQVLATFKPDSRSVGVQVFNYMATDTHESLGVLANNYQPYNEKRVNNRDRVGTTSFNLCQQCCNMAKNYRCPEHCSWNRLIDWEQDRNNLFSHTKDILKEKEDLKSESLFCDPQLLGDCNSKNSLQMDQGFSYLEKDNLEHLDSPTSSRPATIKKSLQMKRPRYLRNILQELDEVYAIEECIFEENKKLREWHEKRQREARKEQESVFKELKEKMLFLSLLEREKHHVKSLEKSLEREEAKKDKLLRNKKQMDKIKKYCHGVVRENIRMILESPSSHFK